MAIYSIYVIQLLQQPNKLLLNYTTGSVNTKLTEFKDKHPRLSSARLRPDLYNNIGTLSNNLATMSQCKQRIKLLENDGYEVIAGTPLFMNHWRVYVLKIDNNPKKIYVGQSKYPPEIRLKQHQCGYFSATTLKPSMKLELFPSIYEQLPEFDSEFKSKEAEHNMSESFKKLGYTVFGGH